MRYFDGKKEAVDILAAARYRVEKLKKRGVKIPKAAAIVIGNNSQNEKYVYSKSNTFSNVGLLLEVIQISDGLPADKVIEKIDSFNKDKNYAGVMIQLPIKGNFSEEEKSKIINSIDPKKDFDGMLKESQFDAPVVRSVMKVFEEGKECIDHSNYPYQVALVGAKGFVGKKILTKLSKYDSRNYSVKKYDLGDNLTNVKKADFIISATGNAGLIKPSYVKKDAVIIDVGYPKGDFDVKCYKKALFASPVPGGVGPMTIAYLVDNFVRAIEVD